MNFQHFEITADFGEKHFEISAKMPKKVRLLLIFAENILRFVRRSSAIDVGHMKKWDTEFHSGVRIRVLDIFANP